MRVTLSTGLLDGSSSGLHQLRTKSVIRSRAHFLPVESVTGEFYARVTVSWITPRFNPHRVEDVRDKRPACGWLRSSKGYNCADQGSIVIVIVMLKISASRRAELRIGWAVAQALGLADVGTTRANVVSCLERAAPEPGPLCWQDRLSASADQLETSPTARTGA